MNEGLIRGEKEHGAGDLLGPAHPAERMRLALPATELLGPRAPEELRCAMAPREVRHVRVWCPTDGAAPAWAAPHTVCAGYAQVRGRGGGAARRLTIEATAGKLPYVRGW